MTLGLYNDGETGVQIPHPPLSLRCHLIVEAAICATWALMINHGRPGFNLQTSDEDIVTHELYERLYDEIFNKGIVEGFDRDIFSSVHREPKVRNFNAENPDKMPDLLLDFVDRPSGVMHSQYGLFVECKPVDIKHPAGSEYCDEGLIRFLRGDYAWTMRSAMMIGYARAGYAILPKLFDALLARSSEIATIEQLAPCPRSNPHTASEKVHISIHQRTFQYVDTKEAAPAITIRHLWLKRPS